MPFKKPFLSTAAALSVSLAAATAQATVTFDWATIGNAGNAADTTGFGAVSYEYRIATTEVTNGQYAEFLNAVDPTGANTLELYDIRMANTFGGIELQAGNAVGNRFVVQSGRSNNPVTYVSWFDSIRFTNWLHNGQGSGDTETGAYTLVGGTSTPSNAATITRSSEANYFLPNENEWYKAAYHDASSGTAGNYFLYATGSNSVPISDQPGTNTGESLSAVNYFNNDDDNSNGFNDGYAVWDGSFSGNPFTDVGAYTEADSPYGTFDQNGNVWEWNENTEVDVLGTLEATLRGGSSLNTSDGEGFLRSTFRLPFDLTVDNSNVGFRVGSPVPEPSSLTLIAAGGVLALRRRRR